MRIGVPKEIKALEGRVAIVPGGVQALVADGHEVVIQRGAGVGSGISDEEFVESGAKLLDTAEDVWTAADMIVKVKEPLAAGVRLLPSRTRRSSPTSTSPPRAS